MNLNNLFRGNSRDWIDPECKELVKTGERRASNKRK